MQRSPLTVAAKASCASVTPIDSALPGKRSVPDSVRKVEDPPPIRVRKLKTRPRYVSNEDLSPIRRPRCASPIRVRYADTVPDTSCVPDPCLLCLCGENALRHWRSSSDDTSEFCAVPTRIHTWERVLHRPARNFSIARKTLRGRSACGKCPVFGRRSRVACGARVHASTISIGIASSSP